VCGERYEPESLQRRLWRTGEKPIRYFRVSLMRLVEVTPDAWLSEVGAERYLTGCLGRVTGGAGESALSFITETGDAYRVANDPVGAKIGCSVKVLAYSVLAPLPTPAEPSLWIICPHSSADLWEWRGRAHAGLAYDIFVDTESGQLRRRRASADWTLRTTGGTLRGSDILREPKREIP
jgi:hypothetical protein